MRRKPTRLPRLATLCVKGWTAKPTDNAARVAMLQELTRVLLALPAWHPIDALILPGGYFRGSKAFGASTFAERRAIVRNEEFAIAARIAVGLLDDSSSGIRLVTGVLAKSEDPSERTEQTCQAYGTGGLVAVARKIFPTVQDTQADRFISPYVNDYSSQHRLLKLANGSTAILNACYDIFGLADTGLDWSMRRRAVRRLLTKDGYITQGDRAFADHRSACFKAWTTLIGEHKPDVAIAAIHGFAASGTDGYFQRHGIARASATLDGALIVGAAHVRRALPNPLASTLAAHGVYHEHIFAGVGRLAHRLLPIASQVIEAPSGDTALLRLFTPPSSRSTKVKGAGR